MKHCQHRLSVICSPILQFNLFYIIIRCICNWTMFYNVCKIIEKKKNTGTTIIWDLAFNCWETNHSRHVFNHMKIYWRSVTLFFFFGDNWTWYFICITGFNYLKSQLKVVWGDCSISINLYKLGFKISHVIIYGF